VRLAPDIATTVTCKPGQTTTMSLFHGKTVLITGSARGCGAVLAQGFAQAGASVIGVDVDVERGELIAAQAEQTDGQIEFARCDISVEREVQTVIDQLLERHGRLDCAINNAGTESLAPLVDGTEAAFDALIATNLKGLYFCLKHELAAMSRQPEGGAILNMSSVTSELTAVPENGLYAATKGGVTALTKTAAVEHAKDNISVNALAFAAIDIPDDMIWRYLDAQGISAEQLAQAFPIGRMGRPEELLAAAKYLCSHEARYCTGTTLVLDGGYTAQ
jgi:NAD(P)-dependent dehydrogenase (short-subunit alcohol dehydrogenase family)